MSPFSKCSFIVSFFLEAECTFEATGAAQFCRWTQVTGSSADQFDWSIGSGSTPSVQTGPKTDHTLQTSKGMFLNCHWVIFRLCVANFRKLSSQFF